ncbi:unnamed protein product [Taenia asiatica]|uniref:SCA7 domain-containing protein n=1 Tax=Taenia asiatica TaxID=60517 RepID=A0A158RAD5_TAEAS|nr:unnamed protein product [Taenia asiatica]
MSERNPWELLHYKLENKRLNYSGIYPSSLSLITLVDPLISTNRPLNTRFLGKSEARAEVILCTLCNSIVLLNRLAEHFCVRHKNISTLSTDLCTAVTTSNSGSESSLSSKHSEDLFSYSSNSTNLEPSNTYRHVMLQDCFPQSWNHDDGCGQTPRLFNASDPFNSTNDVSSVEIPVDVTPSIDAVDNAQIGDGNNASTAPDFFDFYDIFPDTSELYDDTNTNNTGVTAINTDNNEINFADLKDSNAYFNDLLHSTQGGEIGKTSTVVPHHGQVATQPMNTYLSTLNESEPYLTMGHSEASDCHSHTLETPSPDFFTLPSASSSSTYSVDSSVFNNTDASSSQCLNTGFPDQCVYSKNYEIKSPPTIMPILVRFNNTTPARLHGENDVEVEQAVASIVNLDEEPTDKKANENKSVSGQPVDEQKMDEKLPILSPMDTVAANVPDHSTSNGWVENTTVGAGTADIDWEIWDSLELPTCDYTEGDTSESLPLLKPNDLLSSLEPYLPESSESQAPFEMSVPLEACQLQQQQQQQRDQQQEPTQLTQTVFPVEQSVVVPVTNSEQHMVKPASSTTDSKSAKGESSSRSRRPMDCLNGSLPLHLLPYISRFYLNSTGVSESTEFVQLTIHVVPEATAAFPSNIKNGPFDPRLHCGVQRDGTVCRRSLLCKLHSMGLKRQVERPQDIGLLVKQLREAKRLKKLKSVSPHQLADSGFKCISGATPIKPAIEVAQSQPLGAISTNATAVGAAAATTPALLRCAYTGNQLQISTGLLSNHTGLQIVEKPLHLQSTAFPQATAGIPPHPGLTVISDGLQTSSLHCDQSVLAHHSSATATPYLHFDQTATGTRTATFLQNRQLCAVIGVAQKTMTQFESGTTTATTGGAAVTTSTTPATTYLAPNAQAATIIVGHPEGTSGTVQYANDKVDSINLLSPNAGPGCISLPPRSARVFQLILPQSATALSLRPHPGSMGSASVIQLTTTGSANLGTTTIPLKQTPVLFETGLDPHTAATATAATMEKAHLHESTMVELQTSGELMDPHKTTQSDASPLLTLAEWDQLHKTGSIVLPTARSLGYAEVPASVAAAATTTVTNTGESSTEMGQISTATSTTTLYDTAPPVLQQDQKEEEGTSTWLDLCPTPSTKDVTTAITTTDGGSFADPLPLSQPPSSGDQESGDKRSSPSTSSNQHSKLRVLLFDVEDEDEEEAILPETGTMAVGEGELESTGVEARGNSSENVQLDKSKEGRLFKGCSVVGSTASLPTAIVAPTAFSIAMTASNGVTNNTNNGNSCGGSSSNSGSPRTCCNAEEGTRDSLKEKPMTPLSAAKRKRLSPVSGHGQQANGFHSSTSTSASPIKQKKSEDPTILLASSATAATINTTSTSTTAVGSAMNSRLSATKVTANVSTGMEIPAALNSGTILSLQPPNAGANRLSVGTTQQIEGITLPVSSAVNCGGNIIICSSATATAIQHQQQQSAPIGTWNRQVKSLDTRSSPLTLVRLPNGQLAAVPSTVFGGTQVTLAAAPPPPPLPPPPPPQQPVLQSHGATLVLRYPQHHPNLQKTGDQFDPNQGVVDPTPATTTNLTIVNGNYQFQQTPHFQHQQRLVMVSSNNKNTAYTAACDHLNDLSSSSISGNTATTGGGTCGGGGGGVGGDVMNTPSSSQTPTMATAFQQTSTGAQPPQLQSPAGTLTVLVRGANSQNSLQLLIPQPDGTMVLQPATMQNQFCGRATTVPPSSVSLLPPPPPVPQLQQQRQQNSTAGGFTQPLLQTGYISVPRGDEASSLFHAPTTGICANGQFANADDANASTTAATAASSGIIEFVPANGVDGSGSILSTGDLSKWIRGGTNTTKVIGGKVSTSQQIFHQQACLDSTNSTIIRLPQAASRAPVSQQQQQQQQLLFLTASNGATTAATTNPHNSFGNVATIVQQTTSLDHNRGVWTANSATTGTTVTTLPNSTSNS